MIGYLPLLKNHTKMITFGLSHTFFSGLGQTFFISLFVPYFMAEFSLSRSEWGFYYSLCTLAAAFSTYWVGAWIDDWKLPKYSLFAGLTLFSACLVIAWSPTLPLLLIALYLLRLGGQSLLSHISATTMSRYFDKERGKALGFVNLGYPLSEAILPLLLSIVATPLGWRGAYFFLAGLTLLLFIPLSQGLLKALPQIHNPHNKKSTNNTTRSQVQKDWRFLLLLPIYTAPPFLITGFFIHQGSLSEVFHGWDMKSISMALAGFAFLRGSGALLVGPLIDRFSGRKLLPFYTLPLFTGVLIATFAQNLWAALLLFTFCGLTAGIGGSIKSAALAELFGTKHLGSIRSSLSTVMVFSTAISPWLFGYLLDKGLHFKDLFFYSLFFLLCCIFLAFLSLRHFKYETHDL